VIFSPDGQYLFSGDNLGNVQLWDLQIQQQYAVWNAHRKSIVRSVSFSPDGKLLATAADDGTAKVWQMGSFDELRGRGCALVRNYLMLQYHQDLSSSDRYLCNGVPQSKQQNTGEKTYDY
jgi:WD40 repeat protein